MSGSPSKTFRFPVYQIDFSAVASGKHIAASKRRIRWRFGFPNHQALDAGRTGTDCRGEEHEIVITWSITSGKRQIIMDGKEIHYASSRTSVLDHSWSTRGNHVLKVVCHAAAPMSPTPGFRQYDLFIDGQSFFTMPKVYELGIRGVGDRSSPVRSSYNNDAGRPPYDYAAPPQQPRIHAPRTPAEEEAELQRAINESLEESRSHLERHGGGGGGAGPDMVSAPPATSAVATDLLDFGGPEPTPPAALPAPAPPSDAYGAPPQPQQQPYPGAPPMPPQQPVGAYPPAASYGDSSISSYHQQQQQQPYLALPAVPGQGGPPPGAPPGAAYGAQPPPPPGAAYAPPPPQQQSYQQSDASFVTTNGAAAGYDDPFAPKPASHNEIANEILSAYGGQSAAGGLATPTANTSAPQGGYETPMYGQSGVQGPALEQDPAQQQKPPPNGGLNLTMSGLAITEEEEEPKNAVEAALRKLVNVDHIDQPAEEKLKLSLKKEENLSAKKHKNKSVPLPPVAKNQVGSGATLEQIQTVKPEAQAKEGIMNAPPQQLFHPNAAMAGALVVHGQGPPPLQPQGFGVGYSNPGQYYQGGPPQQQYYQQQHYQQQQQYQYR